MRTRFAACQCRCHRRNRAWRRYNLGGAALARRQSISRLMMHHAARSRAHVRGMPMSAGAPARRREAHAELLAPFDMSHGAFLEANAALRGTNELLEGEAHRVARLLHDSAGQIVFTLQLAVAGLYRDLPQRFRPRLDRLPPLLAQLDLQLRSHAHELYPGGAGRPRPRGRAGGTHREHPPARGPDDYLRVRTYRTAAKDVESAVYRAIQEVFKNIPATPMRPK